MSVNNSNIDILINKLEIIDEKLSSFKKSISTISEDLESFKSEINDDLKSLKDKVFNLEISSVGEFSSDIVRDGMMYFERTNDPGWSLENSATDVDFSVHNPLGDLE